jgi:hypothetical protein
MNETPAPVSPAPTGGPGQTGAPAPTGGAAPPNTPAAPDAPTGTPAAPAAAAAPAGTPPVETPVVPERYELRLPVGAALDQSDVDLVSKLGKEHGWDNEQAQLTLDEMHKNLVTQGQTFRSELDADPELGGARLEQAQLMANKVLDRFLPATDPQGARLRSTLHKTGYGNFLPLVKLLAGIGKAMSEDQPRMGASAPAFASASRSQADRLFGDAQGIKPPS